MEQVGLLKIINGSLQQGFSQVILQLNKLPQQQKQIIGSLPPAPELAEIYQKWHFFYLAIHDHLQGHFRITFPQNKPFPTNVSQVGFTEICQQLKSCFNEWLDSKGFRPLERQLRSFFTSDIPLRLLIETDDLQLRQFPWHIWTLYTDFPLAELSLSSPHFEQGDKIVLNPSRTVKILAIFGSRDNLDLEVDLATLKKLPDVEINLLIEPSQRTLTDTLWQDHWDILFFAGHSSSAINGEEGYLNLSQDLTLKVGDLSYAIKHAIQQGLQIAIFNSCQGLGIIRELEKLNLHIPQIIVMREPVPDKVAQVFLTYFVKAFSSGKSLYLAVREARERLQALEPPLSATLSPQSSTQMFFPCASWLPIIYQNPAVTPPQWQTLVTQGHEKPSIPWQNKGLRLFTLSTLTTALIILIRLLGGLQGAELKAFDQLLRWRPPEGPDPRLLVVEATEADLNRYGFPLPDQTLAQVIESLNRYQPRVIGLDIFRDRAVEPGVKALAHTFQSQPHVIGLCSLTEINQPNKPGIEPPKTLPLKRIGFSDVLIDFDGVLRRHLLFMQPSLDDPCQTDHSLNMRVAFQYLQREGITPELLESEQIKLGKTVLNPLTDATGAYHKLDTRGYQLMLNYRATEQLAQKITIDDVLSDNFKPDWIKDKAILIGVNAPISADRWGTPYSFQTRRYREVPGVEIQAHMVSQILSSALEGRVLISVLPLWEEILWVWTWSLLGVSLAFVCSKSHYWMLGVVIAVSGLIIIGWLLLLEGIWVPLIPSLMALISGRLVRILMTKQFLSKTQTDIR